MNRLNGTMVYCVGPIDDVKDRGIGWRQSITPFLHSLGVKVLDPCNKAIDKGIEVGDARNRREEIKKQLDQTNDIDTQLFLMKEMQQIMKPIVSVDLRMVDLSDFVILYIDRDAHMCGSYWEAAHSAIQRKPVIVCCKQGLGMIPDWCYGILKYEMFFTTLKEVKDYLSHVNTDILVDDLNRWKFFDYSKLEKERNESTK